MIRTDTMSMASDGKIVLRAWKYFFLHSFAPVLVLFGSIVALRALRLTASRPPGTHWSLFSYLIDNWLLLTIGTASLIWLVKVWRRYSRPFTVLYLRKFSAGKDSTLAEGVVSELLPRYFRLVAIHDSSGHSNPSGRWPTAAGLLAWLCFSSVLPIAILGSFEMLLLAIINTFIITALFLAITFCLRYAVRNRIAYQITDEDSLADASQAILSMRHQSWSPARMMRIRSTEGYWKLAVATLADSVDAILIDVSTLGSGVIWEIETLLPKYPTRVVLISNSTASSGALHEAGCAPTALSDEVQAALQGRRVLTRHGSFFGGVKFHLALRARLLQEVSCRRDSRI
ncbi:hypothetical protein QTI24_29875 [Variovorax sp. J22P240]|uniref:hypothetical protein n=1 Tax=Variovorax sp. J22P240 TaxID=3053514 RepID=UPI0025784D7F|nr:hypothetical protein [Variovorax sp. J22P240]MDM0002832.1 hypothetical protein [Variovorax sp. J22P240]